MQLYNMQPIVACFYNFKNVNMHIKFNNLKNLKLAF